MGNTAHLSSISIQVIQVNAPERHTALSAEAGRALLIRVKSWKCRT